MYVLKSYVGGRTVSTHRVARPECAPLYVSSHAHTVAATYPGKSVVVALLNAAGDLAAQCIRRS